MILDFFARWLPRAAGLAPQEPSASAASAGGVPCPVQPEALEDPRAGQPAPVAANDPSLQLDLPLGPLPLAALNRRAGVRSLRVPQGLRPPVTRLTRGPATLPVPQSSKAMPGDRATGQPTLPFAPPTERVHQDPTDARRAVVVGSLRQVCDTLDRLAEAEAQPRQQPPPG